MRRQSLVSALVVCCLFSSSAFAALQFDQNVTGNLIWGSGNQNGGFTTDRNLGIELALRAKTRYPSPDDSAAGIKSQGNGTYGSFAATGHGGLGTRASWNVDWSINSNYDGSAGSLSGNKYVFERDYDPGVGVNFVQPAYFAADPINGPIYADHAFGTNGTPQGAGLVAPDAANFAFYRGQYNLAQNSTNMDFEDVGNIFDPTADGIYTFRLSAYTLDGLTLLAQTQIDVVVGNGVVPEATALLTWSGLIGCVALVRRRRNG